MTPPNHVAGSRSPAESLANRSRESPAPPAPGPATAVALAGVLSPVGRRRLRRRTPDGIADALLESGHTVPLAGKITVLVFVRANAKRPCSTLARWDTNKRIHVLGRMHRVPKDAQGAQYPRDELLSKRTCRGQHVPSCPCAQRVAHPPGQQRSVELGRFACRPVRASIWLWQVKRSPG